MRRKSPRKSTVGISLFPFLAVLICTMGGLIVLLVVVVQQARVHASTMDAATSLADNEAREQRQIALEDQQWRAEVLEQQRTEIQQQLGVDRPAMAGGGCGRDRRHQCRPRRYGRQRCVRRRRR